MVCHKLCQSRSTNYLTNSSLGTDCPSADVTILCSEKLTHVTSFIHTTRFSELTFIKNNKNPISEIKGCIRTETAKELFDEKDQNKQN